ncbi:MAG: hypothetical protein NTZ33_07080 [Bacteroidetes bacterium]|nr:hypothetical protein [Bacteroidota bacterium]
MLKNKPLLMFLIKAILIYSLLAAPFSFYDGMYGKFYRACSQKLFHRFHDTGFVQFSEGKQKYNTNFNIGNYKIIISNTSAQATIGEINTRYRGYLPTILLISLIIASPVQWKRKFYGLIIGLVILNAYIFLKQWIDILYTSVNTSWLKLYDYNESQKKILEEVYLIFIKNFGLIWVVVVIIWMIVTFRKDDLKLLNYFKLQNEKEK